MNITGSWDVEIQYQVGSARHRIFLAADGNRISGSHMGWACQGDLKGEVSGGAYPIPQHLARGREHAFIYLHGTVSAQGISGDVQMGEYGSVKWNARPRISSSRARK